MCIRPRGSTRACLSDGWRVWSPCKLCHEGECGWPLGRMAYQGGKDQLKPIRRCRSGLLLPWYRKTSKVNSTSRHRRGARGKSVSFVDLYVSMDERNGWRSPRIARGRRTRMPVPGIGRASVRGGTGLAPTEVSENAKRWERSHQLASKFLDGNREA